MTHAASLVLLQGGLCHSGRMTDTPSPTPTRKPPRIWRNVRIAKGGDDAITGLMAEAGPLITRADVFREMFAEVLGSEVAKRRVLRRLQVENHRREDAANERRHRQEKQA